MKLVVWFVFYKSLLAVYEVTLSDMFYSLSCFVGFSPDFVPLHYFRSLRRNMVLMAINLYVRLLALIACFSLVLIVAPYAFQIADYFCVF